MDAPLISVIVPVYNVEAYLDRCVQSIVDQTYRNLEIILVDDGSPDRCPAMCDAWAVKDSRIRVIHKKNGGLSDARNAGVKASAGTYIGFVDSDDYIAAEMYQLLLERIDSDNSDIAACGVKMIWENSAASQMLTCSGSCVLDRDAAMEAVIRESWLKQPVWYKLYRADMIRDILFPVGKYHEDVFWTWRVVARARQISVFDTPCYNYVQRDGSIMAETYSLRRLDAIEAKSQRLTYLKEQYPNLAELGTTELMFSCLYHGQLAQKWLTSHERKLALGSLRSTLKRYGIPKQQSFVNRCWLGMAKINLSFICRIRTTLGIGN